MKSPGKILAILALFFPGLPVHADETANAVLPKFTATDMVPLPYGPNWIDLDGDGHKDWGKLFIPTSLTPDRRHLSFSEMPPS